jgi:hypothetical protein
MNDSMRLQNLRSTSAARYAVQRRYVHMGAQSIASTRPIPGATKMPKHRIFTTEFSKVYPLYIQKAERKNRTKEEVDQIICWLTGYSQAGLKKQIDSRVDFETFFAQAPAIHPNSSLIKGVVCGIRVEEVEDPLMQKIRYLDKLIDELAKGKALGTILRQ